MKELIKLAFNHLQLEGTSGNPGEMKALAKALAKALELDNTHVADPYKKQLKNLAYALRAVSDIYEGKATEEYVLSPLKEYIALSELQEKANGVLAIAKTNDVGKTKTAQSELMTWLEGIFTKTRVQNFEANNQNTNPFRDLPPHHHESNWAKPLLSGEQSIENLTKRLLGDGFKTGENALHPMTVNDASTLSDAIGALKKALVEEQNYTLDEWDMLKPPADGFISSLAYKVNRIAKTLISIDDKAIEGGLVPLRVVEGNVKNLDLPTQLWNARLNGNEDGVKAVTAQMLEELRSALVCSFFAENPLSFPEKENYAGGVLKFVNQSYPSYPRASTTCYDTITTKGNGLPKGSDFTQTLTNQLFDDLEASKMMDNPHVLFSMWELATKCIDTLPTSNTNKQNWDASPFPKVLDYAAWHTHESKARVGRMSEDAQIALANWKDFPTLKEKVQAVISARTESVDAVKTAQTELMAFLKDKFYKPEAQAPA